MLINILYVFSREADPILSEERYIKPQIDTEYIQTLLEDSRDGQLVPTKSVYDIKAENMGLIHKLGTKLYFSTTHKNLDPLEDKNMENATSLMKYLENQSSRISVLIPIMYIFCALSLFMILGGWALPIFSAYFNEIENYILFFVIIFGINLLLLIILSIANTNYKANNMNFLKIEFMKRTHTLNRSVVYKSLEIFNFINNLTDILMQYSYLKDNESKAFWNLLSKIFGIILPIFIIVSLIMSMIITTIYLGVSSLNPTHMQDIKTVLESTDSLQDKKEKINCILSEIFMFSQNAKYNLSIELNKGNFKLLHLTKTLINIPLYAVLFLICIAIIIFSFICISIITFPKSSEEKVKLKMIQSEGILDAKNNFSTIKTYNYTDRHHNHLKKITTQITKNEQISFFYIIFSYLISMGLIFPLIYFLIDILTNIVKIKIAINRIRMHLFPILATIGIKYNIVTKLILASILIGVLIYFLVFPIYSLTTALMHFVLCRTELKRYQGEIISSLKQMRNTDSMTNQYPKKDLPPLDEKNTITINNLSVKYVKDSEDPKTVQPIISNFSLTLHAGDIFTIIGETGGGKSTLFKALSGLIEYDGTILINGVDLKTIKNIDDHIIIVEQSSSIPHDTMLENIAMGIPVIRQDGKEYFDVSQDLVNLVMDLSAIDQTLAQRLLEVINRNTISGGQAQRICLARGFLKILYKLKKKEPILLILLDEIYSALDSSISYKILDLFIVLLDVIEKETGVKPIVAIIEHGYKFTQVLSKNILHLRPTYSSNALDPKFIFEYVPLEEVYNKNESFRANFLAAGAQINPEDAIKNLRQYQNITQYLKKKKSE